MKIGAHVSTREPFSDCIDRAKDVGCEAMQIFVNAPQRWNPVSISDGEISNYLSQNKSSKIDPVIIHSIYLINLASSNSFFYEASKKSLIDDMNKAEKLGALGVNFHVGSTKGKTLDEVLEKIVLAFENILSTSKSDRYLILENSAGAGDIIGDKFEELGKIIQRMKSDRIKVTLDTAHAFASGYDLSTQDGLERMLDKFDKEIGLEQLVCLHLNDSVAPLGSNKDRHANIGNGHIGIDAFRRIVNHKKLKDLPGIIETPNSFDSGEINKLKSLRAN